MNITLILQMVIFAILAIAILVTVHEYGHYIVARKLGIKVLRFSVGFGKPIWSKKAGPDQTEYVISKWPLGGYVKMLDERDCQVADSERHRAFNRQPILNRILVLVAGPAFNFVLAVLFFWLVFVVGVVGAKPLLGKVAAGGLAETAGLQAEDQIMSVNGKMVSTWSEAHLELLDGVIEGSDLILEVQHYQGGQSRQVTINKPDNSKALTEPEALLPGLGVSRWVPESAAMIGGVQDGMPAARADLRVGDIVIAINGISVSEFDDVVAILSELPDETVRVEVLRNATPMAVDIQLASDIRNGKLVGLMGVHFQPTEEARSEWQAQLVTRKYGPIEAFKYAGAETWNMSAMMLGMLGKMAIGQVSVKNISGPLNIARFAGYSARQGPAYYIRFLALLSLSLGVLNLLPIPMLDGGQVVFQLAEAIKGSPLSMRTELLGQQIGLGLLFVLMFFAFRNDIISIFG